MITNSKNDKNWMKENDALGEEVCVEYDDLFYMPPSIIEKTRSLPIIRTVPVSMYKLHKTRLKRIQSRWNAHRSDEGQKRLQLPAMRKRMRQVQFNDRKKGEKKVLFTTVQEQRKKLYSLSSGFVSRMVLRKLEQCQRKTELEHTCEDFEGCVLFVDISGFSSLCSMLTEMEFGIEEIAYRVNKFFSKIIGVVHQFNGDVVTFGGDSLIVFFGYPGHNIPLEHLTIHATRCAHEIMKRYPSYNSDGIELGLHMAVNSGKFFSIMCGNDKWYHLVAGAPLVDIDEAVNSAQRGEICLTSYAYNLIKNSNIFTFTQASSNAWTLTRYISANFRDHTGLKTIERFEVEITQPMNEKIKKFIDNYVIEKLDAKQLNYLSEVRSISIAFIGFKDVVKVDSGVALPLQNAIVCIEDVIKKYDGVINQTIMDEKGITTICVFSGFHRHDSLRSVSASMEIHENLLSLGISNRIGLARGKTYCGNLGSNDRRFYSIVSHTANYSARLLNLESNPGILCDENIYKYSKQNIGFEAHTERPLLKGIGRKTVYVPNNKIPMTPSVVKRQIDSNSQKRKLYRLLIQHRKDLRTRMKKILESKLFPMPDDKPVILVEGSEGNGKTEVLMETLKIGRKLGIKSVYAKGLEVEKSTPYAVWRQIMNGIKEIFQDNIKYPQEEPFDTQKRFILERISEFCRRNSSIMIVFRSLHYFDQHSLKLFLQICETMVEKLFFVCSCRQHYNELILGDNTLVHIYNLSDVFSIPNLTFEEAKLIIQTLTKCAIVGDDIVQIILNHASDNIHFIEEMVNDLKQEGRLVNDKGVLRLHANKDEMTIPQSYKDALYSQFYSLNANCQLILRICSVLGDKFNINLLKDLFPIQKARTKISHILARLRDLNLIKYSTDENYGKFFQSVYCQMIYYTMLKRQKIAFHKQAIECLEQNSRGLYASTNAEYYASLYWHYSASINLGKKTYSYFSKAMDYILLEAGEREEYGQYGRASQCCNSAKEIIAKGKEILESKKSKSWKNHVEAWEGLVERLYQREERVHQLMKAKRVLSLDVIRTQTPQSPT